MHIRRTLAAVSPLLLCAAVVGLAQARPRVAVLPLNYIGVSKNEAAALTTLLETALVKTEAFQVIEQTDMGVVLEAQEKSLADCTDEMCALEIGKLLAAEQIVLGSVSALGATRIVTAGIIDVGTGQRIKGDKVESSSVEGLATQMDLLAFMLAGLTYREGQEEKVATEYGEVFVETVPDGADVSLNGLPKGKSPLVIERVPIGRVSLEARRDTLYASRDVDVTGDGLAKVKLELKISLGNLFLKSSVKEGIRVSLDGKDVGLLGAGLLEKVPAGEHQIVLSGSGYLWEGRVRVQTGKTVSVEAYPREVGILEYAIPEGAQAELVSKDARIVLRGSGKLENVYAQTYTLRVAETDFEAVDTTVTVSWGQTARVAPTLKRTESYRRTALYNELSAAVQNAVRLAAAGRVVSASDVREVDALEGRLAAAEFRFADLVDRAKALRVELASRLEKQTADDARASFVRRLSELESLRSAGRDVVEADVSAAQRLSAEIAASSLASEELRVRGRTVVHDLKVRSLEDRKKALEARLAQVTRSRCGLMVTGGALLGVGVVGTATAVISYIAGREAHAVYHAAIYSPEAEAAWARVSLFFGLLNVGIASGCGGAGLGLLLVLAAPSTKVLDRDLAAVRQELVRLGAEGR